MNNGDSALAERADRNYREMFRTMARLSPMGVVEEDPGLLCVYTGPQLPLCNAAIVKRAPADPVALVERARAFFARFNQPGALLTAGPLTEVLAAAAGTAGLAPHHSPGMILTPLTGAHPGVPGLEIRVVDSPATLRVYNDTMTGGFGGAWAEGAILDSRALLDEPELTHYLGLLGGAPVATAMRFSSHRIAGVFNVCTLPAYRSRGIGEAITWRAALDGTLEGCIASALQASEMGESIYQRMGYRTVDTYTVWLPAGG